MSDKIDQYLNEMSDDDVDNLLNRLVARRGGRYLSSEDYDFVVTEFRTQLDTLVSMGDDPIAIYEMTKRGVFEEYEDLRARLEQFLAKQG